MNPLQHEITPALGIFYGIVPMHWIEYCIWFKSALEAVKTLSLLPNMNVELSIISTLSSSSFSFNL